MKEQTETMQSEDVEDSMSVQNDVCLNNNEMTFNDSGEPASLKSSPNFNDIDSKSLQINFEADIEKTTPESENSSDESDDKLEVASDTPSTEELPEELVKPSNESIRNWLQKISHMQSEIQKKLNLEQNLGNPSHTFSDFPVAKPQPTQQTSSRVVKYQDLPYMGEMTLDNSKPRRGRKPKKADICHLIYKNYGTIFPGTPTSKTFPEKDHKKAEVTSDPFNKTDVQNRIISSLLEKRLTQESKKQREILCKPPRITSKATLEKNGQHEPLNLCVRDLNQLKIRLLRQSGDFYLPKVKFEPASDDEVEFVKETPSPGFDLKPIFGLDSKDSRISESRLADFLDSRISNSGLPESRISDSRVSHLRISDSRLSESRLSEPKLSDLRLSDSRLDSGLIDSRLIDSGLLDPRLLDARLSDSRIPDLKLLQSKLPNTRLSDSKLSESRLAGSKLSKSRITDSRVNSRLLDSKLIDSKLLDSKLLDPRLLDSRLLDPRLLDSRILDATSSNISDLINPDSANTDSRPDLQIIDSNHDSKNENVKNSDSDLRNSELRNLDPRNSDLKNLDLKMIDPRTIDPKNLENGPPGFVYWPNAGVFIHPMALQQQLMYYQKLAQNNNVSVPNHVDASPESNQELRKLAPKPKSKKGDGGNEHHENKSKRNASHNADKTPAKRKRSAIFIPPIPPENQTNPATEVSICKFKFTGGAKPSLQEKKMLSVDSGGNFRYYSGTGDKSMRGYEFFPRETLQQQIGNAQGSSTGAFLQASGEKIHPSSIPDNKPSHSDFMLTPDISPNLPATPELSPKQKKRRSRKSLQREKLEQTFKEKGFLIQTQKLESAEGATYCKFRQLRKFTRYLFRSWKDYLPGNVAEGQVVEAPELEDGSEFDGLDNGEHSPKDFTAAT